MISYCLQLANNACATFNMLFTIPSTILFFGVAIFLTLRTRFIQFRGLPRFVHLLTHGFKRKSEHDAQGHVTTISSFHALFTAMASTIGMGNVVGPSVAIMVGGPGALFWLLTYIFFGAASKFTEVTFALATRVETPRGLIGGPMQYLRLIHPSLALWYTSVMIFLFMSWSSLQANTLASILKQENVSPLLVGLSLSVLVVMVLSGGVKRVGDVASKLVPLMFVLYVLFGFGILFRDPAALLHALKLIVSSVLHPSAALGGFAGASVLTAMQVGIYRSIFITEAGIGTSSIPHAMADTQRPTDQGLLALYSMASDAILSLLSGLMILVTGVWTTGAFRSTLIYEAFKNSAPLYGKYILLISVALFVITTVIGNTFNGAQSFASLTRSRWVKTYVGASALAICAGALLPVQFMWNVMDMLLTLVAIPNVIGLLVLSLSRSKTLEIE